MGDRRSSRVDSTLEYLLESFIAPQLLGEDEVAFKDRCDDAVLRGKSVVDQGSNLRVSEINQANDLIRRKLLRDNASPEKAARFGNLYSRLLSTPVLNQKWSILYLLYRISEDSYAEWRTLSPDDLSQSVAQRTQAGNSSDHMNRRDRTPENPLPIESEIQTATSSSPQDRHAKPRAGRQQAAGAKKLDEGIGQVEAEDPKKFVVEPSESTLLRDLPFNLQGLSSACLNFTIPKCVSLPSTLPIPILSLLHSLSEPCLLYQGLSEFTQASDGGLICQSLRAAIGVELRSYLSLVATLEGEIRRGLAAIGNEESASDIRKVGVTLKRCVIWTRDATLGLRLMTLVVDESKLKKGGQLISLVHGFASTHGDPFVSGFAERLLPQLTRPFYDMLRRWIYEGELVDPYREFMISESDPTTRPDVDPRRVETSVWEDKYNLDHSMTPSVVSADFAKKIFLIGKSLNFLRHNCGDSDWVIEHSKSARTELRYGDTATLEGSIDEAYKTTMTRLTHLMSHKYHLFTHLTAIKKYLLLSQGDFIALLMESLAPHLDRPAYSQYRHTLTSQLEHAIRHSNAQFDDPDVLRRLDARMVELSSGEVGWDSFTLEYKISAPCDVVITQWASMQYLKVFNLLWRIKRVEFSLSTTWRRCMTGSRGVLVSIEGKRAGDWKRARCVVAEMVHFVNQLQYYILFEVIEASWEVLQEAMEKPDSTLDDLIEAHKKYINSITHKGLLGNPRHSSTGQREDSFLSQLHYILKNMLAYKDAVDSLYSYSVAEFARRQELSARIEHRTAQGKWGVTERDLLPSESSRSSTPTSAFNQHGRGSALGSDLDTPLPLGVGIVGDDGNLLVSLRARLLQLSGEFKGRINVLLYDLAHQPDVDMRFLGVVMNFNEVYRPVNMRRQVAKAKEREREREREKGKGIEREMKKKEEEKEKVTQKKVQRPKKEVAADEENGRVRNGSGTEERDGDVDDKAD
jgi:gamma-tubulin complex component 3